MTKEDQNIKSITLDDIPIENRNNNYIRGTYGVSRVSAWRLLSGKSSHICPGYHVANISIAGNAWDVITNPDIVRHIRKCVAYQLKIWRRENCISTYIDDIAQECYMRAYQKSGIWINMPEEKKMAYLATLSKRTTNDHMKKHVHYTDTHKNDMYLFDACKKI